MSTKNAQQRYRVVSDNDGHDYVIKAEREHEANFYNWVEAMENGLDSEHDFEGQRVNCSGWTFADPQGWE
jgi:hypothetical protein